MCSASWSHIFGVSGVMEHKFAEPASGFSPASFTEGDASQAMRSPGNFSAMAGVSILDVPGSEPLQPREGVFTYRGEVQRPKKKNPIQSYECLEEAGVRGRGKEPELLSGDETSTGGENNETVNLPDSSGTTVSSDEEADSVRHNSKGCGKSVTLHGQGPNVRRSKKRSSTSNIVSLKDSENTEVVGEGADEGILTSPACRNSVQRVQSTPEMLVHSNAPPKNAGVEVVVDFEVQKISELEDEHPILIDTFHVQSRRMVDNMNVNSDEEEVRVLDDVEGQNLKEDAVPSSKCLGEQNPQQDEFLGSDCLEGQTQHKQEVPGSDCLKGRNPTSKNGTPRESSKAEAVQCKPTAEKTGRTPKEPKKPEIMECKPMMEKSVETCTNMIDTDKEAAYANAEVPECGQAKVVQEAKDVEGIEGVRVEGERVKKRHSSGSKKRKKNSDVAEEEAFPTSMENLYSAKATTLTALNDVVMQAVDEDGAEVASEEGVQFVDEEEGQDGCEVGGEGHSPNKEVTEAPSKVASAAVRVKTRSQDKVQTTQVKKSKKRRRT